MPDAPVLRLMDVALDSAMVVADDTAVEPPELRTMLPLAVVVDRVIAPVEDRVMAEPAPAVEVVDRVIAPTDERAKALAVDMVIDPAAVNPRAALVDTDMSPTELMPRVDAVEMVMAPVEPRAMVPALFTVMLGPPADMTREPVGAAKVMPPAVELSVIAPEEVMAMVDAVDDRAIAPFAVMEIP